MASNSAFTRPPFSLDGGSSSWADDDDMDLPAIPVTTNMPKVEEAHDESHKQQHDQHQEEEHHHERERDPHDRRDDYEHDRGYSRGGYDRAPPAPRREKNPLPDQPPYKLYVGNLPFRMNEDDLASFLGNESHIVNIRMPCDYESNRPKGFAYVDYDDRDAAQQALQLDGTEVMSRSIRIDVAIEKERKPRTGNSYFTEKRGNRDYPDRGDRGDRGDRRDRDYGDRDHPRRQEQARRPENDEPEKPKERPRLHLQPRTASSEQSQSSGAKKSSIFGDAKPRDENVYLERQKSREMEKKKQAEEEKEKQKKETKTTSPRNPPREEPKQTRAPKNEDTSSKPKDLSRDQKTERDESQQGGGRGGGRGAPRRGGGRSGGGRFHEDRGNVEHGGERGGERGGDRGGDRGGRRGDSGRGRGGERGERGERGDRRGRDSNEQQGTQKQRTSARDQATAAAAPPPAAAAQAPPAPATKKPTGPAGRFGAEAKTKYVAVPNTVNKYGALLDDDDSDSD